MAIEIFVSTASRMVDFETATVVGVPAGDDLPALGHPAGLAPEIRVVAVASRGRTCGHLSTGALR